MKKMIKIICLTIVLLVLNQSEIHDKVIYPRQYFQPIIEQKTMAKEEIKIPKDKDTKNKTYMDYKLITDKNSPQYKFIQENCRVSGNGFLMVNDEWYCVALGSYFDDDIGTKYIVTLDTGKEIKIVKTELKSDLHTCDLNYQHKIDGSVLEFLLDTSMLQDQKTENGYLWNGNLNNIDEFNGNIIKIERMVE